jgi:hypothetical protein
LVGCRFEILILNVLAAFPVDSYFLENGRKTGPMQTKTILHPRQNLMLQGEVQEVFFWQSVLRNFMLISAGLQAHLNRTKNLLALSPIGGH